MKKNRPEPLQPHSFPHSSFFFLFSLKKTSPIHIILFLTEINPLIRYKLRRLNKFKEIEINPPLSSQISDETRYSFGAT